MLTISVVVPVYNEQSRIGGCLDSLLNQTVPFNEIIIVDNGSTDRSREIVAAAAQTNPVIRLIDEPEPGCYAARATGYDVAVSDIIARTDADVHVSETWAESIVTFFDGTSDIDGTAFSAVTGPMTVYDGPPFAIVEKIATRQPKGHENGREIGSVTGPNHAMRRLAWKEIRENLTARQDVWEDADMGMALTEAGLRCFYNPRMVVAGSIRAQRKSPIKQWHYITGGIRTAQARGNRAAVKVMKADLPVRFVLFTGMWLLFRPWDNESQTWKISRLFRALDDEHGDVTKDRSSTQDS
ncbi:glycosyltransferase [Jongsikchunia kroppenstedtii]|uniref:glycosyltransferase n=1 Tax=Jongsikchunia kroppenstedtii TaxID=1121721 RepID=UPI0003611AC1|nr:glycosyltransferase [Jongsikchunia kroppenstedtii]